MGDYKKFFQTFLLLIATLCLIPPLRAQPTATASLDPARVETGDTFALRVLVSGAKVAPKRVDFSAWKSYLPAKNILSQSAWTRSGAQWVQRFTLIAFDSADWQLPPLTVHLHLGDTVQTNTLALGVTPTPASADPLEMDAIRDIYREPAHWTDYWPWAAGILTILLLLIWYVRRKRKRQKPVFTEVKPTPVAVPPNEIALQKLAALEQEKPWKKDRLLEYYAALSMIIREYLEHRYGILALESTTREIAALLKPTAFPDDLKAPLDYLLQQADMIKYAETTPPAAFHEKALENARTIVLKTA